MKSCPDHHTPSSSITRYKHDENDHHQNTSCNDVYPYASDTYTYDHHPDSHSNHRSNDYSNHTLDHHIYQHINHTAHYQNESNSSYNADRHHDNDSYTYDDNGDSDGARYDSTHHNNY